MAVASNAAPRLPVAGNMSVIIVSLSAAPLAIVAAKPANCAPHRFHPIRETGIGDE